MRKFGCSILIPCLDEKRTILRAVNDAGKNAARVFGKRYEVIVADNGSTDGTLELLKTIKKVRVLNVPVKGYGAALHWGILKSKYEYVLFADADLSYPFSNISKFSALIPKAPDLLLGSRIKGKIEKGSMPHLHRYLGTPILTFLINVVYGIRTTDCNSGMRLVKKSFYKKLNMRNSGMEWASELICKTALKNGVYMETPILFKKDKRGRKPHLSSWSDGWRHLKAIFFLKPKTLYLFLAIFTSVSIYYYEINFAISFLFAGLTVVLGLSLATLHLLSSIIENKRTSLTDFLLKFTLVPLTGALSIFVALLAFIIPNDRLGTKLFLVSIICILFMWVFLIETIKTHLANRLPDK